MSSLRDSLQTIYDQRGELTPRLVVDEARDETHPLHPRFEWDDEIAGEQFRQVQAAQLIRSVRIVYRRAEGKQPERSTRYWQSVRGEDGFAYRPAGEVASDPMLTQIVLMDMKREWKAMQDRYGHFREFVEMVRADVSEGGAA